MAHSVFKPPGDRKRVKLYELRNNDWFDKGTGFCTARFKFNEVTRQEDPRVVVQSEEEPNRVLLETRICKDDGFQKQQETLIVWTEPASGMDMALSFQESDGCSAIWKFINNVQQQLLGIGGSGEDALSDDIPVDPIYNHVSLIAPGLGNLREVQNQISHHSSSQADREGVARFIISDDYIRKLIPLVNVAEDLEDLPSLHRLCTIMKFIILLNDTTIIEHVVADDVVLGVCGALEYDPDFPSHKANHRQWLDKKGRYKEVVRIEDGLIRRKIHQTYRLQYLKDVVLARILDDPTFSVLNSLIFFNQVDIVQHLQTNAAFLKELFGIFARPDVEPERKKEAVLFIQQCCAIAKNLQQPSRQQLYNNFLAHGLLKVINFALRHNDVGVRVGATDVLVSLIDHDPHLIRQTIFRQMNENQQPLTSSLIDLLLVESDLGVKAQIADSIKVLMDPGLQTVPLEALSKKGSTLPNRSRAAPDPQHEMFLSRFYESSAKKLFQPLIDLKGMETAAFSVQQVSLLTYLIEILCFFIRQHTHRSKYFVLSENLGQRVAQLLSSHEKYLKLTAIKFFRHLIGLQDDFYNQQIIQDRLFEPILKITFETMPRDNVLNSACLECFEFIRREGIKPLIDHLVENYREKFNDISCVDTFTNLVAKYDQTKAYPYHGEGLYEELDPNVIKRPRAPRRRRWDNGIKEMDANEEEYFNTLDDEDEASSKAMDATVFDGSLSPAKPLVDYLSDEDTEPMETDKPAGTEPATVPKPPDSEYASDDYSLKLTNDNSGLASPLERLSEKRRREEDMEDELGKLSRNKRRSSFSSVSSSTSTVLRRKRNFANARDTNGTKSAKIAISIPRAIKTGGKGIGIGEGEN